MLSVLINVITSAESASNQLTDDGRKFSTGLFKRLKVRHDLARIFSRVISNLIYAKVLLYAEIMLRPSVDQNHSPTFLRIRRF